MVPDQRSVSVKRVLFPGEGLKLEGVPSEENALRPALPGEQARRGDLGDLGDEGIIFRHEHAA